MSKKDELARQEEAALPAWARETTDHTGVDGAEQDELRFPRLGIAQGLSPEMTPGNPGYIDGLKLFEMFNSLTQATYGRGPLYFIPVHRTIRRIEFVPRDEGGGIRDLNVPKGDPRTQWTGDGDERQPPAATKFYEFLVLMVNPETSAVEPIVISIKDTNKWNRTAGANLYTYISLPHPAVNRVLPIYGKVYTIESGTAQNDSGTFGVPVIKQAGDVPGLAVKSIVSNDAVRKAAEQFAKSLEGKSFDVDRDTSTDPAAEPLNDDADPKAKDAIPF